MFDDYMILNKSVDVEDEQGQIIIDDITIESNREELKNIIINDLRKQKKSPGKSTTEEMSKAGGQPLQQRIYVGRMVEGKNVNNIKIE